MTRLAVFVCPLVTAACVTLPRVSTSTACQAGGTPSLIVRASDASGKDIGFAPVAVTADDRSSRVVTETSSAGSVRISLSPGSYSVAVGDNVGNWQRVGAPVRMRPGCVVTARAQLIPYEIDPNDTRLRDRVRR